jgi:glutathione reductase (NADPH)
MATGSRPLLPVAPGVELGGTSDDFFQLTEQPKRVAVMGAGYIGVELASMLRALGSSVTLVCRADRPLRRFDPMLGIALGKEMEASGVQFSGSTLVTGLTRTQGGITIQTEGEVLSGFDCVLWAIGRGAVTQGLGLEAAAVELTAEGRIKVDDFQNTSASGIYAVGDVASAVALTPAAIAAGRRLSDRLFGGQPDSKVDLSEVATVIFTHPPIGTVGLSEPEACQRFGAENIRVYESRFTNLYYAVSDNRRPTHMKLVTLLPDEKMLGVHAIGMGADELIQGFAVALKLGATKKDFDRTLAIHPTAAEEMVTMTRHRQGRLDGGPQP